MAGTIYLISTEYLKQNTPINENTADYLLNAAIRDAQTINLLSPDKNLWHQSVEYLHHRV